MEPLSGTVRRARGAIACVVVGVFALAGCTGSGEDEAVVVDDGGDAAEVVAGALEQAAASSGRIDIVADLEEGTTSDIVGSVTMRFAGDDIDVTWRMESLFADGVPGAPDEFEVRMLAVGGSTYMSPTLSFGAPGGDGPALPDGVEWVDVTGEPGQVDTDGVGTTAPTTAELLADLEDLVAVAELDPETIDGERYRAFGATTSVDRATSFFLGETVEERRSANTEGEDDEWAARYDAAIQYGRAHSRAELTVIVDEAGNLRRVTYELSNDIPADHEDCFALWEFRAVGTVVMDVTDLGDVTVEPPDPSAVISSAEAEELLSVDGHSTEFDAEFSAGVGAGGLAGHDDVIAAVQYHAVSLGIDPATVASMSDGDLEAAVDQLPEFDTALGSMSRPGLLSTVRMGMKIEGVAPALADTMSDEQLAELINSYLAAQEGALFDAGPDDEAPYDEFEGCPV